MKVRTNEWKMNERKKEWTSEERTDERIKKKKEKPTNNSKMKVKVSDRLATLEEGTIKEAK